jgi:hypothetical protein
MLEMKRGTTNLIHRGYIFLEPESGVPHQALDPEALALRDYVRQLAQQGLDGNGGQIVGLLDYQNDLCLAPSRWNDVPPPPFPMFPPIYGGVGYSSVEHSNAAERLILALCDPAGCPHTAPYVRLPTYAKGLWKSEYAQYDLPFKITFEFDATALYSEASEAPAWI